jgi:hypothetical protein
MSLRVLFVISGVAFALLWDSVSADGLTAARPPQASEAASASVRDFKERSPGHQGRPQACGEMQGGEFKTAQACPPGTCPCRGGGCARSCC